MTRSLLLCAAVIAVFAVVGCFAAPQGYMRMENRDHTVPAGWRNVGRSVAQKVIKLQVAIKQSNVDQLLAVLDAVSYPRSPQYGMHWTTEQIGALVAPPAERLEKLNLWLRASGVSSKQCDLSLHRDFLTLSLTVSQAEALLKTEFHDFVHENGQVLSRALQYHVPVDIAPELDFIGGVIRFPPAKEHGVQSMIRRSLGVNKPQNGVIESLPSGDAPILGYLLVGDNEFTVNFAPRCPNGQVLTGSTLECPGSEGSIGYAQIEFGPHWDHESISFSLAMASSKPEGSSVCGAVPMWKGTVHTAQLEVLQKYGLTSNTIFCSVRVSHHSFHNFRTMTDVTLATHGAGVSNPTLLPAITPAPWVTPRKLQEHYRIPTGLVNERSENSQSVSEFLGQYYSPSDLTRFFKLMGIPEYKVDKLIGPNIVTQPGLEASLDIQYIMGISHNVSTWFWSLGQLHDGQEPFLQWLIDLSNTPKAPWVHSTSYADEEQSLSLEYMTRVNTELAKAGVRGMTLLFSSGDDGVGGYTLRTNTTICSQRGYAPEFPSSSPFVTAVGGTQFSDRYLPVCDGSMVGSLQYTCDGLGEIVSSSATGSRITSGGGFSINFPRPAYQKKAVDAFLAYSDANGLTPPQHLWNRNGRAFPDISGMAHNYLTVIGDDLVPVDGTSASTPLTAAMITLINDLRLDPGRGGTVGFLNPLLYEIGDQRPTAFTDIVVGDNACSAMRDICCEQGFHATPGWDPATGWGSIVFSALYEHIAGANPFS